MSIKRYGIAERDFWFRLTAQGESWLQATEESWLYRLSTIVLHCTGSRCVGNSHISVRSQTL